MKTTIKYLLAAATLLSLSACGKFPGSPREITVTAAIGPQTKVATTGNQSDFESGDQIAVYAWTNSKTTIPASPMVNGVVNTFDGDKWTPAAPMRWADEASIHYFLGLWPVQTVTVFKAHPYTLDPADQAASDLLVATNLEGLLSSESSVELVFDHMMAKLKVNLAFKNQWETAPTVASVTATAKKTATVDLLAKAVTATGDAVKVGLAKTDNASWAGLQVPQEGMKTVTVTIDSQAFVYTHGESIPLASGKVTTLNLLLGRDTIELASDISIADWTSQGDDLNGKIFKPTE